MSAYLLVVGDERVAWELSASAEVEFYETADDLDPVDVLTNVIRSADASEARLLVTDDGPAAEGLAAKLAGTLGWVAMTTTVLPGDSNIITIGPDATPEAIAAALGLAYVPLNSGDHETSDPGVEPDHSQTRPDPPWVAETAVAAPPPSPPPPQTPEPTPAPEPPQAVGPTPPQMPAPAESRPPVAAPLASPPAETPWRPLQPPPAAAPPAPAAPAPAAAEAPPAAVPAAPPSSSRPSPQMPWHNQPPEPWHNQPPEPPQPQPPAPASPQEPEPTLSAEPSPASTWKGLSTLDDPSFGSAPWAAQTGRSPGAKMGQVIVVASGKGGVGKSTMSMWITEALVQLGHGAVLVDANVGQSDISKMGQVWAEAPGLATLIGRPRLSADDVLSACVTVPGLGPVLASPRESVLLDLDAALEALEQAIRALAAERPFVIVDGPVGTALEPIYTRVLLRLCDKMLMVMKAHEPTLHDCHNWLKSISKPVEEGGSNWDPTRTVAVVNAYSREDGLSAAEIGSLFEGLTLCSPVPAVEATMMMNRGRWRCPSEAAEAVMEVVETVTGIVVDGPPVEKRSLLSRVLRRN